jgi:hypothetical protein
MPSLRKNSPAGSLVGRVSLFFRKVRGLACTGVGSVQAYLDCLFAGLGLPRLLRHRPRVARVVARRRPPSLEHLEVRELLSAVQFTLANYTAKENSPYAVITAKLDTPVNNTVTVHYQTSDGTAQAGTSYQATSGDLSFVPEQLCQAFQVPLLFDNHPGDPNETVNLTLSNPTNADLGSQNTATLTILDRPHQQWSSHPRSTETDLQSSAPMAEFSQRITFTATVTPAPDGNKIPTGYLHFLDGTTLLGVGALDEDGKATFTIMTLDGGSHSITAVFSGDANYASSTSGALTETVSSDPATTTATVSGQNPTVFGQSVTFTATVSPVPPAQGTPTGQVIWRDGTTVLATTNLNSSAQTTYTTSALAVGAHSISASYQGDTHFSASTGGLTQTVNKANSSVALASSSNPALVSQTVTFTATVTAVSPGAGTPSGTVAFKDGSTLLGNGTLNGSGVATFSISTLSLGTHSNITANYGGDGNFNGAQSSALSQQINNPLPSLTSLSQTSANEGDSGFTLTLTGQNFLSTSTVQKNGTTVASTFVSSTQMTVSVSTADLAEEGCLSFTVTNPSPGGGTSNSKTLTIADAALTAGTLSAPSPTEGAPLSNAVLFHFSDADASAAAGDYTGTITWGDGTTSTVTSTASSGGQIVAHNGGGFDILVILPEMSAVNEQETP